MEKQPNERIRCKVRKFKLINLDLYRKYRNNMIEISGNFENNFVNGKGYKKWKRFVLT
jgi:hypothetical protein